MSLKSGTRSAIEKVVKDIRRMTRRQHSSEEKIIRIVRKAYAARRASSNSAAVRSSRRACTTVVRRSFSRWGRSASPATRRQATSSEVQDLRAEALALKEPVQRLQHEHAELEQRIERRPAAVPAEPLAQSSD